MLLNSELDKWARENNLEGIKKNAMIIDGKYVDEYYMAKLYED